LARAAVWSLFPGKHLHQIGLIWTLICWRRSAQLSSCRSRIDAAGFVVHYVIDLAETKHEKQKLVVKLAYSLEADVVNAVTRSLILVPG
jgi:hypothetical protein